MVLCQGRNAVQCHRRRVLCQGLDGPVQWGSAPLLGRRGGGEPGSVKDLPKVTAWSLCLESALLLGRQCACLRSPARAPPRSGPSTWVCGPRAAPMEHRQGRAAPGTRNVRLAGPPRGSFWYPRPFWPLWSRSRPAAGDPRVGWGLRPLLAQRAAAGVLLFE